MPAARHPSASKLPSKPDAKKSSAPAMKPGRPDRTSSKEPDARGPADRDGNEGHARAIGATGKPAR